MKNVTEASRIIDNETRLARKSDSKCKMVGSTNSKKIGQISDVNIQVNNTKCFLQL